MLFHVVMDRRGLLEDRIHYPNCTHLCAILIARCRPQQDDHLVFAVRSPCRYVDAVSNYLVILIVIGEATHFFCLLNIWTIYVAI